MSNCVLWGFEDHLKYFGERPLPGTTRIFETMRNNTLPKENNSVVKLWNDQVRRWTMADLRYTYGGTVPWLIRTLATMHGYDVKIQHRVWEQVHYMDQAATEAQYLISAMSDFGEAKGVDAIDLEPAIYCMLSGTVSLHADFYESAPPPEKGVCVMALQLTPQTQRPVMQQEPEAVQLPWVVAENENVYDPFNDQEADELMDEWYDGRFPPHRV